MTQQTTKALMTAMLLVIGIFVFPQSVWADDADDTVIIDGKSYHVLRNSDDWTRLIALVQKAKGGEEVNAIMDDDFTITACVGQEDHPYCGTFDGNGHTLTVDIDGGNAEYIAPFSYGKDCSVKNLHVVGSVTGGIHSSGLIGHSDGTINVDNCRMSAKVTCTSTHLGGFIGHGQKAKNVINNSLFDGALIGGPSIFTNYGGAFIGWESGDTDNEVHNSLENGAYGNIIHVNFCFNAKNGGSAYGLNSDNLTNNWCYQNWSNMKDHVVGSMSAADLVNRLGSDNWEVAEGGAVPKMFRTDLVATIETYDIIPGTESGDEGTVKIPISSDKQLKWLEASYTDEDGNVKSLGRTELGQNSYSGYVKLPATEAHRNLTVTVKLIVGTTIPINVKNDAVIHNPRLLKADMTQLGTKAETGHEPLLTDAGAVVLKWTTKDMGVTDLLDGDQFLVQRSLTGKMEDYQNIGSVEYDSKDSVYSYKDSLLTKALTAAQIDDSIGIPLVRYRVFRASTQQLWGMDKNPTVAYVQPQMATLALLQPTAAKAAWSNQTERKVKVEWSYLANDNSHNYVWDSRAQMKLEVQTFRRDGSKADSTLTVLTDEQILAQEMEVTLTRSCVKYQMRLIVDGKTSPIGKGEGQLFTLISNAEEYAAYRDSCNSNKLTSRQHAILMADVTIPTNSAMLGSAEEHPYVHNLNGNGYTLSYTNDWAGHWRAIIQHAADGAVVANLKTAGLLYHDCQYGASLVAHVQQGSVFVENCYSAMTIQPTNLSENSRTGGLVGLVGTPDSDTSASLHVSNSHFNGKFLSNKQFSGIVGWRADGSFAVVSNCYHSGTNESNRGNATIMASSGATPWWNVVDGSSYRTKVGTAQGKQSETAPDNWCWQDGKPAVESKSFSTPMPGNTAAVTLPADGLYYENMGSINKDSLGVQTLQSSVLLTWTNVDDEPVDYYEVWRRDTLVKDSICIATQLTEMQYEDKTVSPVHTYEYFVRGVNSCEGTKFSDTKKVIGHCVNTGTVEGYLRFDDGTGIPNYQINITSADSTISEIATTDESGYFRKSGLPYSGGTETTYYAMPGLNSYKKGATPVTFGTAPGENTVSDVVFIVEESVKFSGYVMYDGTSIPVQGVSFMVDSHEVRNSQGKVTTDHEGKFSFRMLEGNHSIQAVKDGHDFWQKGYYHEDEDTTKTTYYFGVDKAGIYFYDQTRVRLIGRVAGGKDQGAIPLGNSLSRNNLGDDLQMVLTLEGDNASRLVWDVLEPKKNTRDEEFVHKSHDNKYTYMTKVHTTLNRMVITPDVHTGEYEVLLPPVKWKVIQITAKGYATLFQDGKTGDVIDLTDSLTEHTDHFTGEWQNANMDPITSVDVKYYAQYSRIYHSPVVIDYKQAVYDKFDYFGDHYYWAKDLEGNKTQVELAYTVRKKDWPVGKKDSLETRYTFGYPVFSIERSYPVKISAVEKYFYNNNTKSDTVDVVKLSGGEVTIHNGMTSSTHRETVALDSLGEAVYVLKAQQLPYMLTGDDALRTVTMTLLMDGTHYEATPLRAYVLNVFNKPGAKDVLPIKQPQLIDILRDPPGGGSSAKLSKGSTLKHSFTMDMQAKTGLTLGLQWGAESSFYVGFVSVAAETGTINGTQNKVGFNIDLVVSLMGKHAYSYTITCNEDISTSSDKYMVGADADVYIGTETNLILKPAVAVRAIPHDMWKKQQGAVMAGRSLEIAQGFNEKGDTIHLMRDEVVTYSPEISSVFHHSQSYITNQLMPQLEDECKSLLFTGSKEEAERQAANTGKPVYWSMLSPDDEKFGMMNYKVTKIGGKTTLEPVYYTNKMDKAPEGNLYYQIILPADYTGKQEDRIADFCQSLQWWMEAISLNEQEKLSATELLKNFNVDGGTGMTYSEDFSSDISSSAYIKYPWSNIGNVAVGLIGAVGKELGKILSSASGGSADNQSPQLQTNQVHLGVTGFKLDIIPVIDIDINGTYGLETKYNRKESFTISMDKQSHLDFDVYRVNSDLADGKADGDFDIFVENNINELTDEVIDKIKGGIFVDDYKKEREWRYSRGFVYRTRGGATCRPYEGERVTKVYNAGTVLDERTKKIENPIIKMDKQSISGVPFGEAARFKLYLANESEVPEAAYPYFDLCLVETSNPKGAKVMMDGMPLTGNSRTVMITPGNVTEKTIEVYAADEYDYEKLRLAIISQGDAKTCQEVEFDVHYLQTAGSVAISTPGDKWIMNTDAPFEEGKGWYLPVIISNFNKNQHNFDHIEFQYKESTRGDDYWTNLCGYYSDKALYDAASGTKEMIPENGNITTRFFGEGQVMEKAYDLRAVLFCRNGNGFLTNSSKVLSGVKDTRRPQLFGTPEPKDGILGAGDNVIFHFSEDIEYNYLQATTNFEVKGETNESNIQEAPALQFSGNDYAESEARRNFADKNVTIEVMVKPDETSEDMPIFSHGRDGKQLQLWVTKDKTLRAVVDDKVLETKTPINFSGFQRVALVLDNDKKKLSIFSNNLDAEMDSVTYSGYGPLVFGSTQQTDVNLRQHYKGRMLQGRIWNRAMDINLLNTYGNQMLTGYEMGLTDYYPMNEGSGDYASDLAQGAHLKLNGADWAQPRGMSLRVDWAEQRDVKGLRLRQNYFQRSSEQDYTLMFWFKTDNDGHGALLSNGSGRKTDVQAADKFFIGFEGKTLKYRTNGKEYPLGDNFSDDMWHHYAMTVNRAHQVASIYVDNEMKAQFATDSLGGMQGTDFYLGNMVWKEEGPNNDVLHQENALTGYLDGIALFEQALPPTLIKRFTAKAIGGQEKGLITYVDFDRQERQKNGDITLQPFVLNKKVTIDKDGNELYDSVFVDPISTIESHVDHTVGAPMQAYEDLRNLNFSFVGRDNLLLVNLDELDSRINKRTVYVTVSDIPDINGNYMASPATKAVFVDRNPLRWGQKTYKATVYPDNNPYIQFDINIVNNSGAAHTYQVTNLPKWLTVNTPTDVIDPKSEQTLTFHIGSDINTGSYDDIIYLTDENGLFEPLALNITVEGANPQWWVDDNMKQFSMNIVARVQIGNDIVSDSRDMVGVFDDSGRCMGVGNVNFDAQSSDALTYLTVFDNTTTKKTLNFKLWHYETGKLMILTPSKTIEFKPESFEGTTKNPIVLTATDQYVQTIDLMPGWNWVSLNVNSNEYRNLSKLLGKYNWQSNDMITDENNNFSLLYYNGEWIVNKGNSKLSDHRLRMDYSYRIKVSNYMQLQLQGSAIKAVGDRTIQVKNGWNSIGYTPMVNLPIATALSDYLEEAEDGDVVKSKTSFAMFSKGANGAREWKGNLKYLKPGEGYMLYRSRQGTAQFTYPFYEANATFFEESNQARAWDDFANNMVMTATAEGIELEEGDKLIAYSGAEIRGEALVSGKVKVNSEKYAAATEQSLFYLTIAGSEQAPLSFAIERNGDIIATTGDVMTYQTNAVSGSPSGPTKISFVRSNLLPQEGWYTVQGIKLQQAPTQRGVYIYNGHKRVIK